MSGGKWEWACQACDATPAIHVVTASGQPFYAGVAEGKQGQLVRFVCDKCAAEYPDNAKRRLA